MSDASVCSSHVRTGGAQRLCRRWALDHSPCTRWACGAVSGGFSFSFFDSPQFFRLCSLRANSLNAHTHEKNMRKMREAAM